MMAKIDPYNHKRRYLKWREEIKNKIPEINKDDSDLILKYLNDMEVGINVAISNKKGARSYVRLNSLRTRIIFVIKKLKNEEVMPMILWLFKGG